MASPATTSRPGVLPPAAAVDEGAAAAATKALSQPAENNNAADAAPANDENKQSIASIFEEGVKNIDTARNDNLFQSLEERPLTDAERAIIDARVAMQRKMYALFEKREKARKAEALIELCPELRLCEAEVALEFCRGSEAAAAEKLTGDWTFVRRVRQACGTTAPVPVAVANANEGGAGAAMTSRNDQNRHLPVPNAPRPKKIELSALGDGVFIGSFRGRVATLGPHNLASKKSGNERGGDGGGAESGEPAPRAGSAEPSGGAGATRGRRAASAGAATAATGPSRSRSRSVSVAPAGAPADGEGQGQGQQQQATATTMTTTTRRPRSASAVPAPSAAVAPASKLGVKHRLVKRLPDGSVVEVSPEEARAALENNTGKSTTTATGAAAAAAAGAPSSSSSLSADMAALGDLVIEALLAPSASPSSSPSSSSISFAAASFLLAMPSEALRSAALAMARARDAEKCAELVAAADAQRQLQQQKQEAKLKRQQRAARLAEAEEAAARANAAAAAAAPPSSSAEPAAVATAAAATSSEEAAPDAPDAAAAAAAPAPAPKRKASAPSARKQAAKKAAAEEEEDKIEEGGEGAAVLAVDAAATAATMTTEETAAAATAPEAPVPESAAAAAAAPFEATPSAGEAAAEAAAPAAPVAASVSISVAALPLVPANAISRNGHTNRGRVRQKSSKQAQLMQVGEVVFEENAAERSLGWHNAGYIFPAGFVSRVAFRSSVALDQVCIHECRVIGRGGVHWPAPTFEVVAMDRPDEPLVAKSCTGCWTAVLRRINAEITARIAAGEDLPPPPKTAIAGPEYFGFCQPEIADAIEALDTGRKCVLYWAGKEERIAAMAGLPPPSYAAGSGGEGGGGPSRVPKAPRALRAAAPAGGAGGGGLARKGSRRRRTADSDSDDGHGRHNEDDEEEEDAEARIGNRWSGVSRAERYRKRLRNNASGDGGGGGDGENGDGEANDADGAEDPDPDNPLPGFIDPITLAPVRDPAIAPSGHVCGMATWKAVLRSTAGGGSSVCPFTKKPLSWEQCVRLTHNNVERFRDRIRT